MFTRSLLVAGLCSAVLSFFALACYCPVGVPPGAFFDGASSGDPSPKLVITQPADDVVTEATKINVSGYTDPGATVTLNGEKLEVRSDGSFSAVFPLQNGENTLTFMAYRLSGGDPTIREITVTANCETGT